MSKLRERPSDFADQYNKLAMNKLMAHYRAGEPTIRRWADEAGLGGVKRHRQHYTPEDLAKIKEMLDDGYAWEDIGAAIDRSPAQVTLRARLEGWGLRADVKAQRKAAMIANLKPKRRQPKAHNLSVALNFNPVTLPGLVRPLAASPDPIGLAAARFMRTFKGPDTFMCRTVTEGEAEPVYCVGRENYKRSDLIARAVSVGFKPEEVDHVPSCGAGLTQ